MPFYRVQPSRPHAHVFSVRLEVTAPRRRGQRLRLPAWIPGSYLVREFARHIIALRAHVDGRPVTVRKRDKACWQVGQLPETGTLVVEYEVYAWDLSVRCAHLDDTHAFFNGTQLFLAVEGQEDQPHQVSILRPSGEAYAGWQIATTLPVATAPAAAESDWLGEFVAPDYDTLIDHPVEMGAFERLSFDAGGVPHEIVITWAVPFDRERLVRDVQAICAQQIALFGAAPFPRYLFMLQVVGEGYGGLEHRDSTALIARRGDLPQAHTDAHDAGYVRLLGLFSHEYFHAWMVKRIRPAAFTPYRLDQENYTTLLWAFEGLTSYYDDYILRRANLISAEHWLELLAKTVAQVMNVPGWQHQSLTESSFDAWIKYYRPDENTPNRVVSYYAKGALVGLCLDLSLRQAGVAEGLDALMRLLWQRHGVTGVGVAEEGVFPLVAELAGQGVARQLRTWVEGCAPLPLARLLTGVGIMLTAPAAADMASRAVEQVSPAGEARQPATLGVRTSSEGGRLKVTYVNEQGAAMNSGLAAGDVLVALDQECLTPERLDALLRRYRAGDEVTVHYFRRDWLSQTRLVLSAPQPEVWALVRQARCSTRQRQQQEAWLHAESESSSLSGTH